MDGHPTRIVAANENFRAVAVSAGRHTVDFRYRPASFRAGAIISILTAVAMLVALAVILVHRRRRTRVG